MYITKVKRLAGLSLLSMCLVMSGCKSLNKSGNADAKPRIETVKFEKANDADGKLVFESDGKQVSLKTEYPAIAKSFETGKYYIVALNSKDEISAFIPDKSKEELQAKEEEAEKEHSDSEKITMSPAKERSGMAVIKKTTLRIPDKEAAVKLYTDAHMDASGKIIQDDAANYALTVEVKGEGEFLLYEGRVQLGKIDYLAFENLDGSEPETTVVSFEEATAAVRINRFKFDSKSGEFEKTVVYDAEGNINLLGNE